MSRDGPVPRRGTKAQPPRHRRAAPRHVDWAELGALFGRHADVAGIKRDSSKVGSKHRGPPMVLGLNPVIRQLFEQLNERKHINMCNKSTCKDAKCHDNYSKTSCSDLFVFKLQLLQIHVESSCSNNFDIPLFTQSDTSQCTHFPVTPDQEKCR